MTMPAEPTITVAQLCRLLDVIDVSKLRDPSGDIDPTKVADLVGNLAAVRSSAPQRGPSNRGLDARGSVDAGRAMFRSRGRAPMTGSENR